MYFSCKELFQKIYEDYALELLAGQKGLASLATGCYTIDEPEDMPIIKIGSLVFTTGLAKHRYPNWLFRYLEAAREHHACAVIFAIGEHLKKTDFNQKALAYCEENHLPLVVMHCHTIKRRLSALYTKCDDLIHAKEQIRTRLETALQEIRYTNLVRPSQTSFITQAGFPPEDNYFVCAMSLPDGTPSHAHSTTDDLYFPDITLDFTKYIVLSALSIAPLSTILYESAGTLYILYKCANNTLVKKFSQFISMKLRSQLHHEMLYFGVSDGFSSLTALATASQQAKTAMRLAAAKETMILTYQDLGIYRIMLAVPNQTPLKAYVNEQLGAVKAYDAKHSSDFSKTLYLYLLHAGSIQAVAKASDCHRNTINHRIRMMKERMGYALDNPQTRCELLIAFLIEEYCKISD